MLSEIKINNFKCFDHIELELGNLNLLLGMNSSGKSSLIQAILLILQQGLAIKRIKKKEFLFNTPPFQDIRNFITNAKEVEIETSIRIDKTMYTLSLNILDEGYGGTFDGGIDDAVFPPITYVSSDRIGARDVYSNQYSSYSSDKFHYFDESAMDYFNKYQKTPVEESIIQDKTISHTLEGQVNYWLTYILNSEIGVEDISGTDYVKAQYKYKDNRFVRPKHIGTGLSYVISILIAGLLSKQNSIIIIENPEIHLHPKAQSRLMEFLIFIATRERQLIIETHSDHIFNGLRKAIKKENISDKEFKTYFFELDKDGLSVPHEINFGKNGNLLKYQAGLFDQFDDDLDELLGLK